MKKIFYTILAMSVLLSCVKEQKFEYRETGKTVWLSSDKPQLSDSPDETTKTRWTGETILWSEGDSVRVAAKGDGKWLASDGTETSAGALVKSESAVEEECATTRFSVPSGFLEASHGSWQFYGIYPASCVTSSLTDASGGIPVKIPQVQIPVRNQDDVRSYDPSADLLVGRTAEITDLEEGESYEMLWERAVAHLDLNFRNIPALEEGEKLISILIRSDQPLVNSFSLGTDGSLTLPEVPGTDNVLTVLQRSSNIVLDSDAAIRDVWLCVRPCTVTELTFEILTDKAVYVKSWTGISRTFSRNRRNTMNVDMKEAVRRVTGNTGAESSLKTVFDTSFDVELPETVLFTFSETTAAGHTTYYDIKMPSLTVRNAIDLHLEILPIYVFGNHDYSGDYYSISGYSVIHNANFYSVQELLHTLGHTFTGYGRYMGEYNIDFQLLSSSGEAVSNENTQFLVTPEPSTTTGSTTYYKGSSFTINFKYTLGGMQREDEQQTISWKGLMLGFIGFVFSSDERSTQNLPDQSVIMNTGPYDRSVSYSFKTNNDENGYGTDYIPAIFRTDQRVDFSWVWHVKNGAFCANDYDFGNMKIKASVSPVFKTAVQDSQDSYSKRCLESSSSLTATYDLPGMNRIPTGTVKIKNTTQNYLTNIFFYRSGEYGIRSPYYPHTGAYSRNQEAEIIMREGEYDIIYEIIDGNTLESWGRFMILGVKVEADSTVSTTTIDGQML